MFQTERCSCLPVDFSCLFPVSSTKSSIWWSAPTMRGLRRSDDRRVLFSGWPWWRVECYVAVRDCTSFSPPNSTLFPPVQPHALPEREPQFTRSRPEKLEGAEVVTPTRPVIDLLASPRRDHMFESFELKSFPSHPVCTYPMHFQKKRKCTTFSVVHSLLTRPSCPSSLSLPPLTHSDTCLHDVWREGRDTQNCERKMRLCNNELFLDTLFLSE